MSLLDVIAAYHEAVDEFSRGDAAPAKNVFSHDNDVTLANPWGPAVLGWQAVSGALDFASSRFSHGKVTEFQRLACYEGSDVATIFELETWQAFVGDRSEPSTFGLRVTSTFRQKNGAWKVVHRHADPIMAPNPEGPLRSSE